MKFQRFQSSIPPLAGQGFLVVTIGIGGGIGIGIGIDSHLYISDLSSCLKKRILDGITGSTG